MEKLYTNFEPDDSSTFFYKNFEGVEFKPMHEMLDDYEAIFYYDRHDQAKRGIFFDRFLNDSGWEYFKAVPGTKILINFCDDWINAENLRVIARTIRIKNLPANRIYLVVMDELFFEFCKKTFSDLAIEGINIFYHNQLQKLTSPAYVNPNIQPTNRFSCLSRNYQPWRSAFYLKLAEEGLLDSFNYSFHRYMPYGSTEDQNDKDINLILSDIKTTLTDKKWSPKAIEWLKNSPYDLGYKQEKWDNVTYDAICSSDIHILIESHFDPYLGDIWRHVKHEFSPKTISPAFCTEKTWKAIACKRPFIPLTTPYFLNDIKEMGLKTFSPWIDESFDKEEHNMKRMNMIIDEIKRLNNLSKEEWDSLKKGVKEVVDHNYNVYIEQWKNNDIYYAHNGFFEGLFPYLSKSFTNHMPTLTSTMKDSIDADFKKNHPDEYKRRKNE